MRPALFALVALGLGGCTPMQWVRDGAVPAPEVVENDSATCQQEAWREAQYRYWAYSGPFFPVIRRDPFNRGFFTYPYGPLSYPFYDPLFEESRLADFCMRSKGYRLVPVEAPKNTQLSPSRGALNGSDQVPLETPDMCR
jgi:hypothetical protein